MKEYLIVFSPSDGGERFAIMPSTRKMALWFLRNVRNCEKIMILSDPPLEGLMEVKELIKALRRLMVEIGSLACLGCGYEHNCGLHGCRLMDEAASRLEILQTGLALIKKMHESAKGAEKALLGEVLELLGGVTSGGTK